MSGQTGFGTGDLGMTGEQALELLFEGHRRFLEGKRTGAHKEPDFVGMTAGQFPHAAILCCSDSRVPPEHIFDQTHGEIFVVRVAGNIAGPSEVGSLEYAVAELEVPLILVKGHYGCGAVKAAIKGGAKGAMGDLVDQIRPALELVLRQDERTADVMAEAVKANVRHTIETLLSRSSVINKKFKAGNLLITGAVYSFTKGQVELLSQTG